MKEINRSFATRLEARAKVLLKEIDRRLRAVEEKAGISEEGNAHFFTDEQVEVYAKAFREGDAVRAENDWYEVSEDYTKGTIGHASNYGVNCFRLNFKKENEREYEGVIGGFRVTQEEEPFKITTTADYDLQGGEKLVWLGENLYLMKTGDVFDVKKDEYGTPFIRAMKFYKLTGLKGRDWGVIPKFDQVKKQEDKK